MEALDGRRERDTYVYMTVEEPRAGVISLESDADLGAPNTDNVAAGGLTKLVGPFML
jgi:hypothetical protein